MDSFEVVANLGSGSFGSVRKALDKHSGKLVAIKTLNKDFETWDQVTSLREVRLLMRVNHPNVISLLQVIRDHRNKLHLVFEYVEGSLLNRMTDKNAPDSVKPLSEVQIRNVVYQILQGLCHLHARSIMHRDLKPENILIDSNLTVRICDLGLARSVTDEPPFTSYHATRWYRAPELLLQADRYSTAVDIWALGCIVAELHTGRPLFPGTSELNQIVTICSIKGTFKDETWPFGAELVRKMRVQLPHHEPKNWSSVVPNVSNEAIQLIEASLRWNPEKRATAAEAILYPYFDVYE